MYDSLLSIVCPIYNCSRFIDELIESLLLGANSAEIEFIFVDDRSTDGSYERCRNMLAFYSERVRFKWRLLQHTENRGVAAARNTGINEAKGAYIGFLDADDVLLQNYGAFVLSALRYLEPEILEFNYLELVDADDVCEPEQGGSDRGFSHAFGWRKFMLLFSHGFFCWNKIGKAELIKSCLFDDDRRAYEDVGFCLRLYVKAVRVMRWHEPLLGYRQRAGSTTSVRDKRFTDQFTQLNEGMDLIRCSGQGALIVELRYLLKTILILLKGIKIRPLEDRADFFQTVRNEVSFGSYFGPLMARVSKGLAYVIATVSRRYGVSGY